MHASIALLNLQCKSACMHACITLLETVDSMYCIPCRIVNIEEHYGTPTFPYARTDHLYCSVLSNDGIGSRTRTRTRTRTVELLTSSHTCFPHSTPFVFDDPPAVPHNRLVVWPPRSKVSFLFSEARDAQLLVAEQSHRIESALYCIVLQCNAMHCIILY